MTAKRFEMVITGVDGSFHYLDKNTGEKITSTLELENKLNELHEQVQAQATVIKEYQDRNEILNQQICDKNKILLKEIEIGKKLHDENNHIKQTIQDMMENERTEIGQSVLRQLWEAIQ